MNSKSEQREAENHVKQVTATGWVLVRLGEVANLLTGFPFKSDKYVDDSNAPRLLRGDNVAQGILRWDGAKRWPQAATKDVAEYWLREGDIILAMDRPWIEAGLKYASVRDSDLPSLLVQRVARLRGTDRLHTRFLKYVIASKAFTDYVLAVQTGTTIPHISGDQIKSFEFLLPPLQQQRSIAHILHTFDDKIELNQQMNKTLEAIGKATFKHWFVDFEFPNEEGRPYKSSGGEMAYSEELEKEIPKGWQPDKLGNHSIIKGRIGWKGLQVSEYVDQGPYIVGGSQLLDNRVNWDNCPRVPQERYDESADIMLRESDILMTKDGTIGKLAFVNELPGPSTVASGIFVIRNNSQTLNQMYLWSLFKSDTFRWLVETRIEGSVIPHLYQRDIADLQIVLPTRDVASEFGLAARSIQRKISANSEFSLRLRRMRDSLLPKLMSGKIRVPVEAG